MSNLHLTADYKGKHSEHHVTLNLISFEEDKLYYVYSPSLDLTGYGKSEPEARKSFETVLFEFVKYTDNKNTLIKELKQLGWDIKLRGKKIKKVTAPTYSEMLESNEEFNKIVNEKPYTQTLEEVVMPF